MFSVITLNDVMEFVVLILKLVYMTVKVSYVLLVTALFCAFPFGLHRHGGLVVKASAS